MNKGELTVRQQLILDYIRSFFAANMYPPTIRDIGRSVGIASTSVVSYNLDKVRDAGELKTHATRIDKFATSFVAMVKRLAA